MGKKKIQNTPSPPIISPPQSPSVSPTPTSKDISNDIKPSRSRNNSLLDFLSSITTDTTRKRIPITTRGKKRLFSLYRLLLLELNLSNNQKQDDVHTHQEDHMISNNSFDELVNMCKIPFHLEKYMMFGLLVCINTFLTLFTLAPLKIGIISIQTLFKGKNKHSFQLVKRDLITFSLIAISIYILSTLNLDISRMYHDIRGQTDIKLYVMFGVLEVAEKLCSSLGQDIFNILCEDQNQFRFVIFYILGMFYLSFHAYILIYQTVSLNVAVNSYSNALMTLLLSNQFSELKGSVFKKFEREGLFQITMADLSERFQLSLMLSIIGLRNLSQLSNNGSLIPHSFYKNWNIWLGAIFGPGFIVIGSEIFVDWLKHCYISKFNRFRPRIYRNFLYVSSLDFIQMFHHTNNQREFTDYLSLTRRIGLPLLPTIVCFLKMTLPDFKTIFITPGSILTSGCVILVTYLTLLLIRVIIGLVVFKIANSIVINHKQHQTELKRKVVIPTPIKNTSTILETPPPKDEIYSQVAINSTFLRGSPNTESSSINPKTRIHLYDHNEKIPPTPEEKRNKNLIKGPFNTSNLQSDDEEGLSPVMRYKMSSKRIW
ncbi:Endoplasmic reticulum membrane protein 65 [Spathaspora sp. JA1]|nr:Endoplasmic reticulum membrane protein 65 [Spathaspora sp. JA1]